MKIEIYHGTSKSAAEKILAEGFSVETLNNWPVPSRPGFIYLSMAYGPFYAHKAADNAEDNEGSLVKVSLDMEDAYPDDDMLMAGLGKPVYNFEELNSLDPEKWKGSAQFSLDSLGSIAAKPEHLEVLGAKHFSTQGLIWVCDPVITPMAYKFMGNYYKRLSEHIYEKGEFKTFDVQRAWE